METLLIAEAHAHAVRFDRESACSETRRDRGNPQHISQPMSAVLQHYGLLETEDNQAGELPRLEMAAAGCESYLST